MVVTLSKAIFENLTKQIVSFEDKKKKLIEEYFPQQLKEQDEVENLINQYILQLSCFLREAKKAEKNSGRLPLVTIGSEVEVQDLDSEKKYIFRVMMPSEQSNAFEGVFNISFWSPVGKALLLKKPGDKVTVKAPGGIYNYQIVSINMNVS
ncbi:MAG: GreA/GreB family elongation factor [Bacillota bacterium]